MRVQIAPVVSTFKLRWHPDGYEGEPAEIIVRQASTGDMLRLAKLHEEQTQVVSVRESDNSQVQFQQKWNPEERKRKQAFLTLAGCTIEDENGEPIFQFKDNRISMPELTFCRIWDALPYDLTDEIHRCIARVNRQWGADGDEDTSF